MTHYTIVATTLGALSLYAVFMAMSGLLTMAVPAGRDWLTNTLWERERALVWIAALVASTAMLGSLYLSEVVGFVPCRFCWYQRFAMYPLVPILGAAAVLGKPGVWKIGVPLALVGLSISIYHVALQYQPTLEVVPCGDGPPCSGVYVRVFGILSIPWMAGAAFMLIVALLAVAGMIHVRAVRQSEEEAAAEAVETADESPARS